MGAFMGCWFICVVLGIMLSVINSTLCDILKAIKNHNTQTPSGLEFCEQPPEKDLNSTSCCDTLTE